MTRDIDDCGDELVHDVRTHAIAIDATDPMAAPDEARAADLRALDPVLGDADVVGLGEATHRSREFVRVKHRLFRYLVRRQGVRVLGIEAQFAETLALREYVRHGVGDAESALAELVFRIHWTEEMATLVRWMRSFNEGRPPSDRIAVYGLDVQSPSGAAAALEDYFDEGDAPVSPDTDVRESLGAIADGIVDGDDVDEEDLRTAERVVSELDSVFPDDPERNPASPGVDPAMATVITMVRTSSRSTAID